MKQKAIVAAAIVLAFAAGLAISGRTVISTDARANIQQYELTGKEFACWTSSLDGKTMVFWHYEGQGLASMSAPKLIESRVFVAR